MVEPNDIGIFVTPSINEFKGAREEIAAMVERVDHLKHFSEDKAYLFYNDNHRDSKLADESHDPTIATSTLFLIVVGDCLDSQSIEDLEYVLRFTSNGMGPRLVFAVYGARNADDAVKMLRASVSKGVARRKHPRRQSANGLPPATIEENMGAFFDTLADMAKSTNLNRHVIAPFNTESELRDLLLATLLSWELEPFETTISSGKVVLDDTEIAPVGKHTLAVICQTNRNETSGHVRPDGMPSPGRRICVLSTPSSNSMMQELEAFGATLSNASKEIGDNVRIVVAADGRFRSRSDHAKLQTAELAYLVSTNAEKQVEDFLRDTQILAQNGLEPDPHLPHIYSYAKLASRVSERAMLERISYYRGSYTNADDIKFALAFDLYHNRDDNGRLTIDEGALRLDGRRILHLWSVPAYMYAIWQSISKLDSLSTKIKGVQRQLEDNPENGSLRQTLYQLGKECESAWAEHAITERTLPNLFTRLAELTVPGIHPLVPWFAEIRFLLEKGDYLLALGVLRNENNEKRARSLDAMRTDRNTFSAAEMSKAIAWQSDYLAGLLLRIDVRWVYGASKPNLTAIMNDYERCLEVATIWNLSIDFAVPYIRLLADNGNIPHAVEVSNAVIADARERDDMATVADVFMALAHCAKREGKSNHNERDHLLSALSIRERLVLRDPETFEPALANTLNSLAVCDYRMGNLQRARETYLRALSVRLRVCSRNQYSGEPGIARTLSGLARCELELGDLEIAEDHYRCAIIIFERVAKDRKISFYPILATTLCSLATYYTNVGRNLDALRCYVRAHDLYLLLSINNLLITYESKLTNVLSNMAPLLSSSPEYEEADNSSLITMINALERLARKEPDKYEPSYAEALMAYAQSAEDAGDTPLAHSLYSQASEIFNRLRMKDQQAYGPRYTKALTGRDKTDGQDGLGELFDHPSDYPELSEHNDQGNSRHGGLQRVRDALGSLIGSRRRS